MAFYNDTPRGGSDDRVTKKEYVRGWFLALTAVAVLLLVIATGVGGCAGVKAFNRSQRRADANNAVKVTTINIRKAQQAARITAANDAHVKALADQRLIEARGIRAAQDEISRTLTPLYIQHEAIQAQLKMAGSPNHTVIWAPSGANGTPLVSTIDLQRAAEQRAGK